MFLYCVVLYCCILCCVVLLRRVDVMFCGFCFLLLCCFVVLCCCAVVLLCYVVVLLFCCVVALCCVGVFCCSFLFCFLFCCFTLCFFVMLVWIHQMFKWSDAFGQRDWRRGRECSDISGDVLQSLCKIPDFTVCFRCSERAAKLNCNIQISRRTVTLVFVTFIITKYCWKQLLLHCF